MSRASPPSTTPSKMLTGTVCIATARKSWYVVGSRPTNQGIGISENTS